MNELTIRDFNKLFDEKKLIRTGTPETEEYRQYQADLTNETVNAPAKRWPISRIERVLGSSDGIQFKYLGRGNSFDIKELFGVLEAEYFGISREVLRLLIADDSLKGILFYFISREVYILELSDDGDGGDGVKVKLPIQ